MLAQEGMEKIWERGESAEQSWLQLPFQSGAAVNVGLGYGKTLSNPHSSMEACGVNFG